MNQAFDFTFARQRHHDLINEATRMRQARQARKAKRSRRLWNR